MVLGFTLRFIGLSNYSLIHCWACSLSCCPSDAFKGVLSTLSRVGTKSLDPPLQGSGIGFSYQALLKECKLGGGYLLALNPGLCRALESAPHQI